MQLSKLMPCPFCGNVRIEKKITQQKVIIGCRKCGAKIARGRKKKYLSIEQCRQHNEALVVEVWNRRKGHD